MPPRMKSNSMKTSQVHTECGVAEKQCERRHTEQKYQAIVHGMSPFRAIGACKWRVPCHAMNEQMASNGIKKRCDLRNLGINAA
jgi:hypothetical protein